MYEFHKDKEAYFKQQVENAANYVIPFIEKTFPVKKGMNVLEVGCAEAGVLKAFLNADCVGVGVELSDSRAQMAKDFLKEDIAQNKVRIISKNIYDDSFISEFTNQFDLIVLKDVIEHIHDQQKIIIQLKAFLKPGGKIFFGFPPWYMPFGGHQQVCKNKLLAKLPYYHLLPMPIYKMVLKWGGEKETTIADLVEVKDTGISIERFESCLHKAGLKIDNKTYYMINPIYQYKFGWQPRKQNKLISAIPFVRNFFTTCMYYLVG